MVLYGNGDVNKDNRDNQFDITLYWSSEKIFSGKGPWRNHMKMFAWSTKGKRTIYDSTTLLVNYEMREFNSPGAASTAAANKIAATMEDKL